MSGQQHAPAALYPRERSGTHFTGGWVGPRDGLNGRKISSPPGFNLEPSSPVAQSLYRLSYRAHLPCGEESCNSRIPPTLLTTIRVFSLTPCTQTHPVYYFPVRSDTRFATHNKKREAKGINCKIWVPKEHDCRSRWPRGLRRGSGAARLLRLWVRIPQEAWMFVVSVMCCQVEVCGSDWSLVQRSPTNCGVPEYDLETWTMSTPMSTTTRMP